MMSVFSTSPQMAGTTTLPFTGTTRFTPSKRYERSASRPTGLFPTNPNAISISPGKQPSPPDRIDDAFFYPNWTSNENDQGHDRGRQDLSHEFKSLSHEERAPIGDNEGEEDADLLARTVHLRFLPTGMRQGELADLCRECGEYLRVRICGNATSNQNWIYGFVEFATRDGANRMMKKSGLELPNGPERPPLRLKCSAAKQRIVDRVFHDVNLETGMPCTFGLGGFAARTLKDALASYFSLKTKDGAGGGGGKAGATARPPPPPAAAETWRIHGGPATTLRPGALAFAPSRPAPPPAADGADSPVGGTPRRRGVLGEVPSAAQLTAELRAMVERGVVADGGAVVARGRALALEGLRHGGDDAVAVAPLTTLLALLAKHRVLTGGAAEVAGGAVSAALPQRATRLRLLANLLLALRHLARRGLATALPFIEATLHTCHEVPLVPLRRPIPREGNGKAGVGGGAGEGFPPVLPTPIGRGEGEGKGGKGGDFIPYTPWERRGGGAMFDIIADAPENILSAVVSSLPDEEAEDEGEDGEEAEGGGGSTRQSSDHRELLSGPSSSLGRGAGGGGPPTGDASSDAEELYHRDVAFHGYVLSVLVTIGLAMEGVNPLITYKVSELAARYADNVLGMRCAVLDAFLRDVGEPPYMSSGVRLSASVIPELGDSHDITAFPRFFFNSLNSNLLKALEDPQEFWMKLPPLHCVRCIPC